METKVEVGEIDYRLFNTFKFEDLYIEDQKNDTLLFVDKAYADFNFWGFFKKKFTFNKLTLDGLNGSLVVDSNGVSNLDFIIQAFKKPKKEPKPSPVEFNFKDFKLTNSGFKIFSLKKTAKEEQNRFDGNRMVFSNINADITVDHFRGDSLAATIHSFSTKEKSGLTIEQLKTEIRGFKTEFSFPYLNLKLPNSMIAMDSVRMSYDSLSNFQDVINKVRWQANLKPSKVALKDLSAFVPNFSGLIDPVDVKAKISGRISSFRINDLELKYRNSFQLRANVDLNGIPDFDETFIYADIKDFRLNRAETQDFISHISKKPFILPKELARLGTIRYSGNISGFFNNLVAYGNINTDVGNLNTDILLSLENNMQDIRYNGTVQSNSFQLGRLLANNTLGKVAFKINTNGSKLHNRSLKGSISGTIPEIYLNKYTYQNIKLDGNYDGSGFDGKLQINDPNLVADFNGIVDLSQKLPVFNFDLLVENVDIHALKLTSKYEDSSLSFRGNTNMIGNSLDNLNGYLLLDSIYFYNKGKELAMESLLFESKVENGSSNFTITSDLINGYFDGEFKYSAIPSIAATIVHTYLPALSGKNIVKSQIKEVGGNHIDINLVISDTKMISDVLELPFSLDGITTVSGHLDEADQEMNFDLATPFLSFGKRTIQDIVINVDNEGNRLNLLASGHYIQKSSLLDFDIKANAINDSLYTQFEWQNRDSVVNAGELQFITKFTKENNLTSALMTFLPTQMILFDSIWDVHSSQIAINPDTTLDIRNFRVQNKEQFIIVDGVVSKNETDLVQVEMNDIDLGFIMGLLNLRPISINGRTTGTASLYGILKQPVFEANLFLKNAFLNEEPIGDAYIYSGWDNRNSEMLISGTFLEGNDTVALANGFYSLKNDSIDLIYDANKLNVSFLQRYLRTIVQDLNAKATGTVRMFGKTNNIGFEGAVFVEDASLTVGVLNTTYSFRDSIYLTRESIRLKDITVFDEDKNQGRLDGLITHDGSFMNMKYDVKINARNMMALNTKPVHNDVFYGKAYATGNVHIFGNESVSNIDVVATSQPKTKMYISVGGTEMINDNDFVTFVNRNDTTQTTVSIPDKPKANVSITLLLDVNPEADIHLIIDPQSGDMISANGSGNLRLEYDQNVGLKLYGGYTIERGNFLFTLQNLIRKQFRIEQGSNITWSGNPERARLDIRAVHSLTASLYDLMSSDVLSSTDRTSVPVEVVINLTEDLMQPNIGFEVNLPSSDETLKMQVKNLMNTQEMLNRQTVYLLLFGKFYTPDYNRTAATGVNSFGTAISSLLSSTGIGQINRWLSQFSSNLSLGFNWRNTGYGDMQTYEWEGAVNFQPNNRIFINGNIGYRDDNFAKNKIIGDLDIEYLLTENSKWRLKAFNHTVDRYSLRAAPFIQGVGIMYKENFNTWRELWRNYMEIFKKEEKEDNDSPVSEFTIQKKDTLYVEKPFITFDSARKIQRIEVNDSAFSRIPINLNDSVLTLLSSQD
ncbi:MAG: translocation/assembly module TamB [Porphyromonadaceae bacterium]|nr:translocation/assembly module TamB [Porphyromonadaceae bacterium]